QSRSEPRSAVASLTSSPRRAAPRRTADASNKASPRDGARHAALLVQLKDASVGGVELLYSLQSQRECGPIWHRLFVPDLPPRVSELTGLHPSLRLSYRMDAGFEATLRDGTFTKTSLTGRSPTRSRSIDPSGALYPAPLPVHVRLRQTPPRPALCASRSG